MILHKLGATAKGARLERIKKSPHFRNGTFHNVHHTPQLTEGATIPRILYGFLFGKSERKIPTGAIPTIHTDLFLLPRGEDVLVWFGHSSYFIQVDGLTFLVDP